MSNLINSPHKNFESIKKNDEVGNEYWFARELMPLLEYTEWRNFDQTVIEKAKHACEKSGQLSKNHFVDVNKMVRIGSSAKRKQKDYKLSRYACYLIAQNGDPRKKAIALAQTYFAIQARKQELTGEFDEEERRLFIRQEVTEQNKHLASTAKKAGVKNFGRFNRAGYEGLYGMTLEKLKDKKKIGKDNILDRAGSTELAANLFRITQTDEKIEKEQIKGEGRANWTHRGVGSQVRQAMQKISGTLPEDLPAQPHIKQIKQKQKQGLLGQPTFEDLSEKEK